MNYNPKIHRRKSTRLKGFDYSQPRFYFITLNTKYRECHLGKIKNGIMYLSEMGKIAHDCWITIPDHYPNTQLDAFVIMPNHLHGLIRIVRNPYMELDLDVGATDSVAPSTMPNANFQPKGPKSNSIGAILGQYKSVVTKKIKKAQPNSMWQGWQRNYDDRIIRNKDHLYRTRKYIQNNPKNWASDQDNPYNFP